MNNLQGCGTALVTPFTQDFRVDYTAYRSMVQRQMEAGIHFLVPLGTTGETPCLDEEEKAEILRIVKEVSGGKVPVVAGAGSNSTKRVIENVKFLGEAGADAFLVVTPYYNKPTQAGMYEHYKAVAASTDKPVIIYNVPGRTGVNITAETTLRLAEISNITAVKEASGNYAQINEIIRCAPEGFNVLSGNDDETLSLMFTGAKGVISVASNVAPEMMVQLTGAIAAGNIQRARELHYKLTPLFRNLFIESNPIPAKSALGQMGLMQNVLRQPLTPATPATAAIMSDTLKALGLL
jgi:4-hydroxy-tetrahydrodipicolinate synthase